MRPDFRFEATQDTTSGHVFKLCVQGQTQAGHKIFHTTSPCSDIFNTDIYPYKDYFIAICYPYRDNIINYISPHGDIKMNRAYRWLQLQQADEQLKPMLKQRHPPRPSNGWIKTIREALGMTAVALARQLNVRSSTVHKLEKSEADDSISLASLRKVAEALNCELHYALVPRTSLETKLRNQAKLVARKNLFPVSHSMALEDQSVTNKAQQAQLELLEKELLDGNWRELW
jgi:predicted DNA-binding mobile mystery protein A